MDGQTEAKRVPTFGSNPYFSIEGRIIDRHGREVDPGEVVIFKVNDLALPELLDEYREWCAEMDSPIEHCDAAAQLYHEVEAWQKENAKKVHTAD